MPPSCANYPRDALICAFALCFFAAHLETNHNSQFREAREAGAYAQAFWLCARCSAALAAMPEVVPHTLHLLQELWKLMHDSVNMQWALTPQAYLQRLPSQLESGPGKLMKMWGICQNATDSMSARSHVAHEAGLAQVCAAQAMAASVVSAHEETVQRMATALTASCADFHAERYTQVRDCTSILRVMPNPGTLHNRHYRLKSQCGACVGPVIMAATCHWQR